MTTKISVLQYINRFIRSLVFTLFISIVTTFYCAICLLAFPFPLRYRYALIAFWTRMMVCAMKVICQIDYHVEGLENIPKNRNGVVLCKHQSTWETFFLPSFFHQAAIIVKRELLWVPFFGWGMATIDPIAINRSDKANAMQQVISKGKKCLAAGRWILMFPEGTRIAPGKIGNYRMGGARLAVSAGCPVIPVAHNAGRFWPKGKFLKKPGTIQMVIGPVIETAGRTPEDVMAEVKAWIETTILKIDV